MGDIGTRKTRVFVDDIEFTDSVSVVEIRSTDSDSDFTSFEDAANGGNKDYAFGATIKQSTTVDSLHDYAWSKTGQEVEVVVWLDGMPVGGTPSAAQPSHTGTVVITDPDGVLLGGAANASATAKQVIEVEWKYLAKPVKAVA